MPNKIFKIWTASAVVGFMMVLAAGCANFSNFGDTSLPENIYLRTAGKYQSARVGIFRFDSVVDAPRAGGRAADMLYKQLLKDRVFQEFYTEFSGEYPLTLEDRLRGQGKRL